MYQLTIQESIAAVRKNLDEIGLNESVMYDTQNTDNESLDDIIARNIPEAINRVHLAAPVAMLEGEDFSGGYNSLAIRDGVLSFSLTADYLRLVAFKAADSAIVITDEIPESSPEARKQLNPFIRGRYDRPRLVRQQGSHSSPAFSYYSLKSNAYNNNPIRAIERFSFVREQFYNPDAESYKVSKSLRQNALDTLTALVLAIYGYNDKANYFSEKAKPI